MQEGADNMKCRMVLIMVLLTLFCAQKGFPMKTVFIVQSYDPDFVWSQQIDQGIRDALYGSATDIRVYYMNTRLKNQPDWKIKAGELAKTKIAEEKPDIVIICDDDAQEYFGKDVEGIPIVFCGVNQPPARYDYPRENVTGVLEIPFFEESIRYAESFFPSIRRILFLGDQGITTEGMLERARTVEFPGIETVDTISVATFEEWKTVISQSTRYDAIFLTAYRVLADRVGSSVPTEEVGSWTAENSPIPVFALLDYMVEEGILGGVVQSPYRQGYQAGLLTLEILFKGAIPSSLPLSELKNGERMINIKTAQRFGLGESLLSKGSFDRIVGFGNIPENHYLRSIVSLFEEVLKGIENCLSTLARLPAPYRSQWEILKPSLKSIEEVYSGLGFFGTPDGYYSVTRNWTGLDLKDRAYYPILEKGKTVTGAPVYSRSTGEPSLVVAVPLMDGPILASYYGFSLYLNPLVIRLRNLISLPEQSAYYFCDRSGKLVFSNQEAIAYPEEHEMASLFQHMPKSSQSEGSFFFTSPKGIYAVFYRKSLETGWTGFFTVQSKSFENGKDSPENQLVSIHEKITASFSRLAEGLKEAAETLSDSYTNESRTREILTKLRKLDPSIVDATYVDQAGIMKWVEPGEYRNHEGADISDQDQVIRLKETKKPVISDTFMAVEGFLAIDVEWPVFDRFGNWVGSVSLLIRPAMLFSGIADAVQHSDSDFWIMHPTGTIVYDPDAGEIGRNLFTDPLYEPFEALRILGRQMATSASGTGEYSFFALGSDQVVRKKALWKTLKAFDTDLKLIITYF